MANYANIGWIDEETELNGIYVRRDDYVIKGQIGTHNAATGDFAVLPPGTAGQVLTADPASDYGLSWEDPSGETITAGIPAAQSGLSRLTIVDVDDTTTLAIATTGVIPAVYGDAGNVPQLTISNTGQITNAVNIPIPPIAAGVSGAETAGSGLTIVGNTVALSNVLGLPAGGYGNSTTVPSFFVDARGRITNIANVPIVFPPAADQLESVPTRNWGAGSGRVVGIQDNVVIGDSAQTNGQESVAIGRNARAQTLGVSIGTESIATAANCTIVGPLIRAGGSNSVFIGGNISGLSQTAASLNNVAIGNNMLNSLTSGSANICIGSGSGFALTSANNNIIVGPNSAPNLTTSPNNVIIGANTAPVLATGIGRNVIIGSGSGVSTSVSNDAVVIGRDASVINESISVGTLTQAQGVRAAAIGYLASAGTSNGIAIGTSVRVDPAAIGGVAIGNNITNSLTNSCLIGNNNSTNFIVRTNGFFRSARQLGCACGQIPADPRQLFGSGPTLVDIQSIRYDDFAFDGESSIDLVNNRVFLGTHPIDTGSQFKIDVMVRGATDASTSYILTIRQIMPGIAPAPNGIIIGEQTLTTIGGQPASIQCSTTAKISELTTGRCYIDVLMTRVAGVGDFQSAVIRITVYRVN